MRSSILTQDPQKTSRKVASSALLTHHLSLLPFVEYLGVDRRAFFLPGNNKSRLMRAVAVLNVTENKHPSFVEILIQFRYGADLSGKPGILQILQSRSTSLFFAMF